MSDPDLDGLVLDWFSPGDLQFYHDAALGADACIHTITSIDGAKIENPFLVLRKGLDYEVKQFSDYEHNEEDDSYVCNAFRHPALIKQQYGLPDIVPLTGEYLGPFSAVNLERVMRSIQAHISDVPELRENANDYLTTYYEERRPPTVMARPALRVLTFS